ncbi:uncharacterized protein, partial [Watersipora subatra]|uniref:uncharacterized protein n=1 Tax=Watersipora subatra TaxID=2589382 RepID=UPI00355B32A3
MISTDDGEVSDVISTDNEDAENPAGLSEGSNWDYYQVSSSCQQVVFSPQDPPYSTGTEPDLDVDLEPKLDDSVLQWDDELEANIDTPSVEVSTRAQRTHVRMLTLSDSEDSDIEELHHVLTESSDQLSRAKSALNKPHKDVVQCGIYLDPQKYMEWQATCQTNIKCLQSIQQTLGAKQGMDNLTDDDTRQVLDLIHKWQSLEPVATERIQQSSTLCSIYHDILSGKKLVKQCEEQLTMGEFSDVGHLERHFRSLQTLKMNLQSQNLKLQQISDTIIVFESENRKIKMVEFKQQLDGLNASIKSTGLSIGKKVTELSYTLIYWHKWNSACQELEGVLVKHANEIEPEELSQCKERLLGLEASFLDYSSVCSTAAHNYTEEKLASLGARLQYLNSLFVPEAEDKADEIKSVPVDAEELTLKEAYKRSSFPVEAYDANLVSELTLGGAKVGSHKSSMESGFSTMDTERSVLDDNSESYNQVSTHLDMYQDIQAEQTESVIPSVGDTSSLPTLTSPQPLNVTSKIDASSSDIICSSITADSSSVNSAQVPFETQSHSMPGLVEGVSKEQETASNGSRASSSVKELPSTIPVTDQEKPNVVQPNKKGKRNRKKKKNKKSAEVQSRSSADNLLPDESCKQVNLDRPVRVDRTDQEIENSSIDESLMSTHLTQSRPQEDAEPTDQLAVTDHLPVGSAFANMGNEGSLDGFPNGIAKVTPSQSDLDTMLTNKSVCSLTSDTQEPESTTDANADAANDQLLELLYPIGHAGWTQKSLPTAPNQLDPCPLSNEGTEIMIPSTDEQPTELVAPVDTASPCGIDEPAESLGRCMQGTNEQPVGTSDILSLDDVELAQVSDEKEVAVPQNKESVESSRVQQELSQQPIMKDEKMFNEIEMTQQSFKDVETYGSPLVQHENKLHSAPVAGLVVDVCDNRSQEVVPGDYHTSPKVKESPSISSITPEEKLIAAHQSKNGKRNRKKRKNKNKSTKVQSVPSSAESQQTESAEQLTINTPVTMSSSKQDEKTNVNDSFANTQSLTSSLKATSSPGQPTIVDNVPDHDVLKHMDSTSSLDGGHDDTVPDNTDTVTTNPSILMEYD